MLTPKEKLDKVKQARVDECLKPISALFGETANFWGALNYVGICDMDYYNEVKFSANDCKTLAESFLKLANELESDNGHKS